MEKLVISRLALDLLRLNYQTIFGVETFGSRAADGLLLTAVFVGQAEGRPMTASKIAVYAGVPRPSAIRRLDAMGRDGLVLRAANGTYVLEMSRFSGEALESAVTASIQMIIRAGLALSKMDS